MRDEVLGFVTASSDQGRQHVSAPGFRRAHASSASRRLKTCPGACLAGIMPKRVAFLATTRNLYTVYQRVELMAEPAPPGALL